MDLVSRALNITRTPKSEWPVIAGEATNVIALYIDYVALLAAIPLIAELIHLLLSDWSIGIAIRIVLIGYFASLVDVAVVAFASELLAPRFGGVGDRVQAFKLAAFAFTPSWLGGIFLLIPAVGWFLRFVFGIYSLYVYYLGIEELMAIPSERRVPYFALVIVLSIAIGIAVALVVALIFGFSGVGKIG